MLYVNSIIIYNYYCLVLLNRNYILLLKKKKRKLREKGDLRDSRFIIILSNEHLPRMLGHC